jgi:ATP-binding cassette subfamily B protein
VHRHIPATAGLWRAAAALFRDRRPSLTVAVLFAAAQTAALIPVALLISRIVDHAIPAGDRGEIVLTGVAIAVLYALSAALGLASRRIAVRATKRAVSDLRNTLMRRLYDLPRPWHDSRSETDLHAMLVVDTEHADAAMSQVADPLVPALLVAVVLVAVAAVINPVLCSVVLLTLVVLTVVTRKLGRRYHTDVDRYRAAYRDYSADVQLALRMLALAQATGAEDAESSRRRDVVQRLAERGLRMVWTMSSFGAVRGAVTAIGGIVVLVVGGLEATSGAMTVGELLSFYALIVLALRQLGSVGSALASLVPGAQAIVRLQALADASHPTPYSGSRPARAPGVVRLSDVTFGYGADPVVQDVSLTVARGEHVALVGPNGAGKSTILRLVLGLYRPSSGSVLIDETPLDDIDVRALRRHVGILPQDPHIFTGTVAQNIAFGKGDVPREQIRLAAELAGAAEFIDRLEHGFDTEVHDDGSRLSGGQRQRLAIARALLGDPWLLLLDEPTTHLDEDAVDALMRTLATLPGEPPILTVTHDRAVAMAADRVMEIAGGVIRA